MKDHASKRLLLWITVSILLTIIVTACGAGSAEGAGPQTGPGKLAVEWRDSNGRPLQVEPVLEY